MLNLTCSFEDVLEMLNRGDFNNKVPYPKVKKWSNDHVMDPNMSVIWNKEKVTTHNKEIDEWMADYNIAKADSDTMFQNMLKKAIINDLKCVEMQASIIYDRAYALSSDKSEIINKTIGLCNLIHEYQNARSSVSPTSEFK